MTQALMGRTKWAVVGKIAPVVVGTFLLSAALAFAQSPGLPFLGLPIGAKPNGMGGAHLALVQDASAVTSNPSRLPGISGKELFLYNNRFGQDFQYDYLAYGAAPLFARVL